MLTSLYTALSALHANSTAISVVGNNLANLNTPGYKASTLYFRDLVTRAIGGSAGAPEVGFGTAQPTTVRAFTQGAVQTSSSDLDAAVQGQGFFVLKDDSGSTSFTRAGSFHTDASGALMTMTGERVQGWMVDPATGALDTNAKIGDLVVPVGSLKPPIASSMLTLDLNLDSSAPVNGQADLSYPVQIYDSLGNAHVLTFEFTKTGDNAWDYSVSLPGEDVTGGVAGTPATVHSGQLAFGSDGKITSPAAGTNIAVPIMGFASGAADLTLAWNPFNPSGSGRITQFSGSSEVSASSQDGSAAAQLVRISLSDGGRLLAEYSDEQQLVVGQLALASICNPDSLSAIGNNTYRVTAATATPVIGSPETGGRGKIVGGSIEASNADVATEFMNLIVFQRAYQANSRVVTSSDQISQETINLIR